MSEITEVYNRLGQIETKLASVEANVSNYHELYAKQSWVRDEIFAIREVMASMANNLSELQASSKELFAAHEKFLQDENNRKKALNEAQIEALKKQSVSSWIKNIATFAGWITAVFAAWIVLYPALANALKQVVTNAP